MKMKNLFEALNAQQRSVPQLPAQAKAKHISVLGSKTDPKHPFAGYAVGADESVEPGKKTIGPDKNDPYEQGWRARPGHDFNPYKQGTREYQQWADGQAEREAQPHHYDESISEDFDPENNPWRVTDVDPMSETDFEVALQGPGGQQLNFVIRPVDFVETQLERYQIDTMDVRDLQTGKTMHWGSMNDLGKWLPIFDAIDDYFWNSPPLQAQLAKIIEYHMDAGEQGRNPDLMPGLDKREPHGVAVSADDFIASHDKTQAAMAKMKKGVTEAGSPAQQAAIAISMKKAGKKPKSVSEGERNELDTPAVQAALRKMAERHKGEKWSKEQLAALGKRIAARGQKTVKEDVTKEDIITKLKARLGDYLSDISKEIKKDPDLVDKLTAKAPGDQMGPPVKTVTTDDGHQIQIHGNEDDGFRISIKNKPAATKFANLDEAVMACEMYCAHRRSQTLNADYVEEA